MGGVSTLRERWSLIIFQVAERGDTAYVIVCTITSPGVMAKDCVSEEERVR